MKKWIIRILVGVFIILVLVVAGAALFLGRIVKASVETLGPRMAQVEVKLDNAAVMLFGGRAHLTGLFVGNPPDFKAAYAIKAGDISVQVKPTSLLSDKLILESVKINSPEIIVEGGLTKNNLTKIQENVNSYLNGGTNSPATTTSGAPAKPARKLQINDLVITDAHIQIASLFSTGKSYSLSLPDIHLRNLGSGPEGITAAQVTQQVLVSLTSSITQTAASSIKEFGKGALTRLKDEAGKADIKKAGDKLRNLFKN